MPGHHAVANLIRLQPDAQRPPSGEKGKGAATARHAGKGGASWARHKQREARHRGGIAAEASGTNLLQELIPDL